MRRHDDALGLSHETKVDSEDPLLRRDIAYYQGASHAFGQHLIAWQPRPGPQALVSQRHQPGNQAGETVRSEPVEGRR